MPRVEAKPKETPEQLLRRFNKSVSKSRVLADVRRKRWFVSKSELERIKRKKSSRRLRRTSYPRNSNNNINNNNNNNII
jgi:small subunit ribosomal protein S21